MVRGLGNDIIEISRIAEAIERHGQRFLDRHFTSSEQAYCLKHKESARQFAGRFAAKESCAKALGTGFREGVSFLDFEVLNNSQGKPIVHLSTTLSNEFQITEILLSISHCNEYAMATAMING